ncbi:MAG: cbb3-type cytochrome oxidase subunit 3 [Wenzhouxiangellaceae bacterium]
MIAGIITLLALLGFLAVVVYVFVLKRGEDFDEQSRLPLEEDRDEPKSNDRSSDNRENDS